MPKFSGHMVFYIGVWFFLLSRFTKLMECFFVAIVVSR